MALRSISKAIAGGAAGVATSGLVFVTIPPEVAMPWYGYIAVAVLNAAIGFAAVYLAPRNTG